jgi:hypothetical protein
VIRTALLIAERELRETLRDGRVIGMFLFPLILYPTVLWGVTQYTLMSSGQDAITLAWEGDPETPVWLMHESLDWVPGGRAAYEAGAAEGWVRAERTSDGIVLSGEVPDEPRGAESVLKSRAQDLRAVEAVALAHLYSVPAEPPFGVERIDPPMNKIDVSEILEVMGPVLPGVPALGLVLLATMAFYPALDAAAERERGTLATSLVSHGGTAALVWGKLATVCTLSLLSVFAQGLGLAITMAHLIIVIVASLDSGVSVSFPALPSVGPLVLGLGVFVSAGCVIAALQFFAVLPWRTLQTAESASSVAMSATIGLVGLGWVMGDSGVWVPIANALPLCAEALTGSLSVGAALLAVGVNGGLTIVIAEGARRLLASEAYRR